VPSDERALRREILYRASSGNSAALSVSAQTKLGRAVKMRRTPYQGAHMTKGKHGNKEAKKPKKLPDAPLPLAPAGTTPGALAVASLRKKKW
jgi:hypothetical protein